MKIYINNNIIDTLKLTMIGEGNEGKVYSYKDMAIKIKKERFYLNYENVNILKTINSNRILLPTNIVYNYKHFFGKQNKKNYIGYTTKLIKNVKDKKEIISLSSNILYDEIDELINETRYLSKNRVQLVDIRNNNNIVFNGNIYFVDPGLYRYKKGSPYIELYTKNINEVGISLFYNILLLNYNGNHIKEELILHKKINPEYLDNDTINKISYIYNYENERIFNNTRRRTRPEYLLYVIEKYGSLTNYKYELLKRYIRKEDNDYVKELKKIIN